MKLEKDELNLENGLKKEWIVTNGIGGYASSTIIGANTRKYHGLLVAALNPPAKRFLMLSKLDESIQIGNKKYELFTNIGKQYTSQGYKYLESFTKEILPIFKYKVEDVSISKNICMIYGKNTVQVFYKIRNGKKKAKLILAPIVNCRNFHDMNTNYAAPAGMTLDDYLQAYYGPGNNEATFRTILERYYLADAYSKYYCSKPENSAASQAAKDAALEAANNMKDSCTTIDDLTGLAQKAQQAGEVLDQGDIAVPKGQMVPKFEEWAYGEGRTVGELDVIYAPEYGYFVVGYLGVDEATGVPNVRYALFSAPENDQSALEALSQELLQEINENKHDFYCKEATASSLTTTDVLIVVFFTLAGVAIAAVIVILIVNAMKKNKDTGSRGKSSSKNSSKPSNSKNKAADKPKSSKKRYEEEDEDDEEYDEDEDEDDE